MALSDAIYEPSLIAEIPMGSYAVNGFSDITYPNTGTNELVLLPKITIISIYSS